MHLIIINDLREVYIAIRKEDYEAVRLQLQTCLAGNDTYMDFTDIEGTHHFFTTSFLAKSHVRFQEFN